MASPEVSKDLLEALSASTENEQFAFGRVAQIVKKAVEIHHDTRTSGLPAQLGGNIDGVLYKIYLGPEKEAE